MDTLPVLNHASQKANQAFITVTSSQPYLWARIRNERLPRLIKQWIIVFMRDSFALGSTYCVQRLLDCLQEHPYVTRKAWIWILGMDACAVIDTVASNYIALMQNSELAIALHSQLSHLHFSQDATQKGLQGGEQHESLASKPAAKTITNVINVVSVDAWPLSFYTSTAKIPPSRLFKFFFATLFLFRLLGWQSMVTTVLATFLCFSVHHCTIKRARAAQRQVQSSHDRTTAVMKDALSSLRDIKFSFLESQWETLIDTFREKELQDISRSQTAATIRGILETVAPFVVILTALLTFLYTGGQVRPSIIFAMISTLHQLQDALSFIPRTISDYFGSIDVADRIERNTWHQLKRISL
ncbi:hypothetical protein NQ176_g5122 [Zarea fungicola]|uniref:Uncharacterized protein n=1 Tax=Zarea fungicola TaxID=93591 RepID=A0ACC1NAU8_9HYPO|nr:hypothetical protein NQ176_g5122 [Lecanicillium fungicola]